MLSSLLLAALLLPADLVERPGPGDAAPAFSLASSTGKAVSLAEFKGARTVVLAFFPKAFTPG